MDIKQGSLRKKIYINFFSVLQKITNVIFLGVKLYQASLEVQLHQFNLSDCHEFQ